MDVNKENTLKEEEMLDKIFEFKMIGKQFQREARKAENEQKKLLAKTKNLIAKGDYENAKVTAADVIRKKNECNRYQILGSKVETIAQKLQNSMNTKQLTENISKLTSLMTNFGNLNDIVEMSNNMDQFEKMFDNIDVHSNLMNQAFDNVNVGVYDDNEVNELVNQVAEANGMKIMEELDIGGIKNQVVQNNNLESFNMDLNK